jgi:hypothetical protein
MSAGGECEGSEQSGSNEKETKYRIRAVWEGEEMGCTRVCVCGRREVYGC